ncbi:kelch-like protein 13 [Ambystoma mexicanum]|uniref:kelch-like protein 13 n=1 Tax=Ambystoma mexicanum TaxID=8296 RepID=UPI0037E703CB
MELECRDASLTRSFVSDTYLAKIFEGFGHMRLHNVLCDVILEASGVPFPAHKVILASASSYCKLFFSGNATNPENSESIIRLKDVSAGGLRTVLNFIYSNKLDLSIDNVEDTLKAAEMLLVREAIKLCFTYLEDCLDNGKCMEVLNIVKRHGPEELKLKAMCYLGQNYKHILADERQLQELDKVTLCEILDRKEIEEYSELELFMFTKCWLQKDAARLKEAEDLLKRIRFPLIPLEDLQQSVQVVPFMKTHSSCFKYLQDALSYHSQLYAQPILQSESTSIRSNSERLLVLGGRTTDNSISSSVWIEDEGGSTWEKLGELCNPVYNHCVAVINDFIYVIGGQTRFDPSGKRPSNEVFRFDARNGLWLQVAGMLERRTRFHTDVISEQIIVVGGGTLLGNLTPTVEEYQPAENKWEFTAPFPVAVADHAGTTHKGILYISGGFSTGKAINDVYSYLPRLRRWVVNSPMTLSRCDHGMASIGGKIFCIGGRTLNAGKEWIPVTETEYYCPASDQWNTLKDSPFDCCQFSIVARQSKLYILGGGSLRQMKKEEGVIIYDPEARAWMKAGSLTQPLVDHAACSLKLSQQALAKLQGKDELHSASDS